MLDSNIQFPLYFPDCNETEELFHFCVLVMLRNEIEKKRHAENKE
jgi:hypothetical protein